MLLQFTPLVALTKMAYGLQKAPYHLSPSSCLPEQMEEEDLIKSNRINLAEILLLTPV